MFENVWNPATPDEFVQQLRDHVQNAPTPITAVGGGTALDYLGNVAENAIGVQTKAWDSVIDYPARDMTITVQTGIRIAELQKILAGENQRLPIDIPQIEQTTLGGAIACNVSGPSRYGYGTFRDYLIGMTAVDGTGRLFSAGGRVVKNVAGYDLCKLMIGSIGTLGVLTQVTLKTRPICSGQSFVCGGFEAVQALQEAMHVLNLSETRPVILDVVSGSQQLEALGFPVLPYVLCCGFEGTDNEVAWQCERIQEEIAPAKPIEMGVVSGDQAKLLKQGLTEHAAQETPLTFRIETTPSQALALLNNLRDRCQSIQAHAGNGVVLGHLGDTVSDSQQAQQFISDTRATVVEHGGSLVVTHVCDEWKAGIDCLGPAPVTWTLMQGIRDQLDPQHILNPGHLWPR